MLRRGRARPLISGGALGAGGLRMIERDKTTGGGGDVAGAVLPGELGVDEGAAARVRASFARQGLMAHLGAELATVARGRVTIRLPFADGLTQQSGFFHAGATGAIADSAGGYAGMTLFGPGEEVLTVEFKINLIAPAVGAALEATGQVLRAGRTLTVTQLAVDAIDGEGGRTPVAVGQQTLIRVAAPDRPAVGGDGGRP